MLCIIFIPWRATCSIGACAEALMKTKMVICKMLVAIPILFSIMTSIGCGNDKKSSRSTVSGSTYMSGGICYQNGVPVSQNLCQQAGSYYLNGNICYAYGSNTPVNISYCSNTGGGTTGQVCNGYYYYPWNGQTIQIYCNGQINDCRGYVVYNQAMQPVQCN